MDSHLNIVVLACCLFKYAVSVDPIVEISEPIPIAGLKDIQAHKGRDLDMVCVVQNKPLLTNVFWLRQTESSPNAKVLTTDTTSEEPQKYAIFKPTSISWSLRIQNVEQSDQGTYICRVETQPKTYKLDSRFVRVVEAPRIDSLQTSSDLLVNEGKDMALHCNASGYPPPALIWTRLANADLPDGGKEFRGTTLEVTAVRPDHRGKYLCRAENVAGEEVRIISVGVLFVPRVSAAERTEYQALGYRKELFCDIEAYPEPGQDQVSWNGPAYSERDSNFEVTYSKGANNRVASKLVIHVVRAVDFGNYVCAASNAKGSGDYTITLAESSVPIPDRTGMISGSASPGYVTILTCVMLLSVWILHRR